VQFVPQADCLAVQQDLVQSDPQAVLTFLQQLGFAQATALLPQLDFWLQADLYAFDPHPDFWAQPDLYAFELQAVF